MSRCEADTRDGGVCQAPEYAGVCSRPAAHVSPANDRTIDGHRIEFGMKVWDYDLRPAYVIEVHHIAQDGTTWYRTTRSADGSGAGNIFDALRMWVRHPSTGVRA